eukprot:CAMPEP_0171189020 /NCGR_PEP_ID=MMETSP0790-20130122/18132_1 /TAXON_ID=2925 /ORGANISM="Alexandrium catenella, Strain OF101" /LENGTH=133 /DNA_ID=CAMNT_0011654121 /DNA_START=94 /DNA_END=495 /DNA_ORIENTATION=-
MCVEVPEGAVPGETEVLVKTHDGQDFLCMVPVGVAPGSTFMVQYEGVANPDIPAGEPVSTGGVILGADDTKEYFKMAPAIYQLGQSVTVPRSSGEYSPAVITQVYLTALKPVYEVDVGGATKNVPEDEICLPA